MSKTDKLASILFVPALKLLAHTRLPKLDGVLSVAGFEKPIQVIRDEWGVPHIFAESTNDLFFAQGFVHAQDRFWQMEFNRRLVAGRLAEILGDVALPIDRWMRTLTLRRVGEFEVTLLGEEFRQYLQAYANGINAFIERRRLPVEFLLLRHQPEPWTIADTLSWIKMMAWTLSVNWESEILRAHLIAHLGTELASELEPPHLTHWPYIIPPGADYSSIKLSALDKSSFARPFSGPSPYEGLGSNNWAIAGSKTSTNKPLLANDMHLSLTAPSIWYENHLVSEDFSLTGVTFPGIPGIVSGHNGYVAWGYTNGFADVQDVYMEHLKRLPDGTVQAQYNGDWEETKLIHEEIRIRGKSSVIEEVIITRHGPIINALAPDFCGEQPLSLRWTALEPDTMIQGIFSFAQARNCKQFHNFLKYWTAPVQNVVYADTDGNIGYTFAGKVPIRAKGNGRLPVPGWTDEYEWTGYLPFDALPHLENPPQGYIVTANNRVVGDDYPLPLDLEPIAGDRAQRISEMLMDVGLRGGQDKVDIPFIQRMHFDLTSSSARVVIRYFAQLPLQSSAHYPETDVHAAVKILKEWDGNLLKDSTAAAIYQLFIRKMIWLIFHDKLNPSKQPTKQNELAKENSGNLVSSVVWRPSEDLATRVMGKGPTPILADSSLFGSHWLAWLINLLGEPNSNWFNLGNGEKRDDVMLLALNLTIAELTLLLGSDMKGWSWGKLHQVTFQHSLGSNRILSLLFNLGPYPVGGDNTTIWATGANSQDLDSKYMVGPPFRMIIDLKNFDNSLGILSPGQSGNPASPLYSNQVEAWFKGEYHPLLFNRADVEQGAKHSLKLKPG